ncbi:hypothetical protein FK220_016825 [Flavobacteriaceae bacterium TP-CH-4]|uniref:Uncharacterized protein n=1 Tax=Pelagihabitans pacificus TaxID=2696054 RepID=A0A967AXL0_9FLAO|nr:hypothetical protein [Pelagihabitans pacificus]NHF61018.1 hypothetical protein [Pelagihabitans pacificus]
MTFIMGLSTGIIRVLVLRALAKSFNIRKVEPLETEIPVRKIPIEEKVAPFVKIHLKHMEESQKTNQNQSISRLKDKVESFKHRNRFYDIT